MAPITFVENSKNNDLMFAVLIVYCIFAVALAGGLGLVRMDQYAALGYRSRRALAAYPSFDFTAAFLCCGKGATGVTVEGGNGSGGAAQNTGSNAGVVNQPPTNNHEMELPSYNQAVGSKQ
ncbi:hypothetical protein QBC37DRAFT_376984 [Rhypophila decipiens]|uniref:Uncharacterized protein n=1 Tax=Rhypophila decipiens TaxID=261697 RepID=A0AAN6Y1H1_9PEZI|nr:hypothetical protein QBC37DRAFT_376984 [Rhypophila decipiens]